MITREHCMPYVGQRVVVHTHDGVVHHGILHSVNRQGIYLRTMRGTPVSGEANAADKTKLLGDVPGADEVEQAWFPFFFLPFFALAALYPWGLYW